MSGPGSNAQWILLRELRASAFGRLDFYEEVPARQAVATALVRRGLAAWDAPCYWYGECDPNLNVTDEGRNVDHPDAGAPDPECLCCDGEGLCTEPGANEDLTQIVPVRTSIPCECRWPL